MNKLRRRFILAAMLSLFAVLTAIVAGMNILNYVGVVDSADQAIRMIIDNGGTFPDPMNNSINPGQTDPQKGTASPDGQTPPPKPEGGMSDTSDGHTPPSKPEGGSSDISDGETPPPKPEGDAAGQSGNGISGNGEVPPELPTEDMSDISAEAPYETRYFTVYIKGEDVVGTHMDNIAAVSYDEALSYAKDILKEGKTSGFVDNTYRYKKCSYTSQDGSDGMIVFVDCNKRLEAFVSGVWISVIVSASGLLVVFLLVWFSSKLIFKPVWESEKKQKQFLTDASHELKTPLAIIEANTEVMELESGETKWTRSTKHQVDRLSGLIAQMVDLTRLSEGETDMTEIALSDLISETIENYQAPAEVSSHPLDIHITRDLYIRANEKNIRRLIGLLMDNAIKYADENTAIKAELVQRGKKVVFTIYNRARGIKKGNNDILFERFYRADASRNSETGGSGIGLAVARSIVEGAKGRISAYSEEGDELLITVAWQKVRETS